MVDIRKQILIIPLIISFALLGGIVGHSILAQNNIPVLYTSSSDTGIGPIFTEEMGPIYPGLSISNTLRIQNDLNIDVVLT